MSEPSKKKLLYFCPQMVHTAQYVAMQERERVQLVPIDWKCYDDGTPAEILSTADVPLDAVTGRDVVFLAEFDPWNDALRQFMFLETLLSAKPRTCRIILPYFPVAQCDREDVRGRVVSAKWLAKQFKMLQKPTCGFNELLIFDLHEKAEEKFFKSKGLRLKLVSAMPLARCRYSPLGFAVAFPDKGAYARFASEFFGYDAIICKKRRGSGNERVVVIASGDPAGRDILIVDDAIQSGNTTIRAGEALLAAGARSVSAFAAHGVFPLESWNSDGWKIFKEVTVTDSCLGIWREHVFDNPEGIFKGATLQPLIAELVVS